MINEQKFWSFVHKTDTCWLWTGYKFQPSGYGGLWTNRKRQYELAHRLSYEISHGPIPDGMVICHRCDVRSCVNPDHLFLGTLLDNNVDMVKKNRQAKGDTIGKGGRKRLGERNGRSKITLAQAQEIQKRYAAGGISQTALAAQYGIGQAQVWRIIQGWQWNSTQEEMTKKPKRVKGRAIIPISERFWAKVQKGEGCWLWLGYVDKRGRPQFSVHNPVSGKHTGRVASRIAYELANNCHLPDDTVVAHSCDNPTCVNPDHLRACTQAENIQECHAKNRDRWHNGHNRSFFKP